MRFARDTSFVEDGLIPNWSTFQRPSRLLCSTSTRHDDLSPIGEPWPIAPRAPPEMEVLNNRGPTVFVVTLVLTILATVFIVLRLISKWGVTGKATSDDFVAIIAWLFAIGLSILPQWENPLERSIYAFTIFYNPAIMSTKTAILTLYHRMAAAHPFLRYASLFLMAVVNIAGIVLTFLNIFQCHPISAAFNETDGTCIDIVALYLSSAPINVLTDLAILLLPLPILTSLRIEFRQKVILVATFIVGGFVTIVGVVRIVYLQQALKEERQIDPSASITATTPPANFTYQASFSLMWSAVEVCVGIMCCCVLVLKPLVMRVMPKLLRAHHGHHNPSGTPESLLRSDIMDLRALAGLHFGEVPGSPLSTSITHQIALPVSSPAGNFSDFINIKSKVPLTQLSANEAWWPIMFVSILFFLWGFAHGMIGTLDTEIQNLLGYTPSHTIALHNAYWAAYFFGPLLVGYWVLKYQGFKATFMTGLTIYATGAMSFWPSSVLRSYAGFVISNFIIAFGLSCVEVAANPFIALAGPGELSEARLNFSQAIQAIRLVISPITAHKGLFSVIGQEDLFRVQWCYLAVALFVVFLAIIFYYVPLSEADDDDLEAMALQRLYNAGLVKGDKAFGVDARHLLWSGLCMMLIPVGAQETVSYFWTPLVQDAKPGSNPFGDQAISHAAFAVGRFLAVGLCYFGIPPRISVGIFAFGAFVTTLLTIVLPQGSAALAMLLLITFFESPLFPTMFAIIIRGQGKHTKFTSVALVMAEAGATIWPSIAYAVDKRNSRSSLIVTVLLWGVLMLWPGMLSSTRVMRRWVDPKWSRQRVATGEPRHGAAVAPGSPGFRHEVPVTAHTETVPKRPTAGTSPPDYGGRPRKSTVSIDT
ncbi:hypothetical protein EHS25_000897 [Saitozyma podzolica]|uniref:Rhodopsin domain-containing protein n=1 Tax=Saitozyma podzolica TaxID=1890683 RepID=A0A427YXJ6_9TREE|nr:hypothetical protein EHS25_000897 [Saitozyma podzolica]